jgi:hypothetical protein
MKRKVLFVTIVIILAVAGTYWVWEKNEMATPIPAPQAVGLPTVPNGPDVNTDTEVEVIEPRINPDTGWKIFEHPDVPITFEYPGEMKVTSITFINKEGWRPGPSITIKDQDRQIDVEFAIPIEGGGYAWNFAKTIEERKIAIDGKKFKTSIAGDSSDSDATTYYVATSLPKPFVAVIACKEYGCSRDKTLSLFRQFASSIKILPE